MCLAYTDGQVAQFFGFDIEKSHETMVRRINEILALSGGQIKLAPEFTFTMIAILAAFISFVTMKNSVNYAFYTFVILRTASRDSASNFLNTQSETHKYSF